MAVFEHPWGVWGMSSEEHAVLDEPFMHVQ